MYQYNDPKFKARRQELRVNQTNYEYILWSKLRNRQCGGYRFFRQYGLGPYIVDFYCPKLRLSIELDGGQHAQQEEYDRIRTEYIKANEIIELRFWNNEVKENIEGVYEQILNFIENNPPQL